MRAADMQAATNAAVAGIIGHHTQVLQSQTPEVHSLRQEIAQSRGTVEKQDIEIAEHNRHIVELSATVAHHGVTPHRFPQN